MRSIPDGHLRYPVSITLSDGSSASGFYFNSSKHLYFVTARHVLFNNKDGVFEPKCGRVRLTSYPHELKLSNQILLDIPLNDFFKKGNVKYDKVQDAAIIQCGEYLSNSQIKLLDGATIKCDAGVLLTVPKDHIKLYKDVLLGNDVFIFGYPNSLGIKDQPQIDYKSPLLRKGVIAGINDNRQAIILDCPVYPGNSGGPVIEVEMVALGQWKFTVIGVVSEFVPYVDVWESKRHGNINTFIENSGYSVVTPIDVIIKLIDELNNNVLVVTADNHK